MEKFLIILAVVFAITSCTSVESGHKGVEVSWGGETSMSRVYNEGMQWGFHWLYDDMIIFDCKEKTVVEKYEFNDNNNMTTPVEISVDYKLAANNVHKLHKHVS